jgi:adenylylsulfate kinase
MTKLTDKKSTTQPNHIKWHPSTVNLKQRIKAKGHKPAVLWYTGLSGSGKSTIANAVDKELYDLGCHGYVLDGDNIRHGLNSDLSFNDSDRAENIRRVGEVSRLFADAGMLVSTAFISPFRAGRESVREMCSGDVEFIEIFIDTPYEICQQRDPKGLYKKANAGKITNFTGLDSNYETPISPEIHIKTESKTVEACAEQVLNYLRNNHLI